MENKNVWLVMENKNVWVVIEEYLHYDMSYKKIIGVFDNEDKAKQTVKSLYNRYLNEEVDSNSFDEEECKGQVWSPYDEITTVYYNQFTLNVDYTLN